MSTDHGLLVVVPADYRLLLAPVAAEIVSVCVVAGGWRLLIGLTSAAAQRPGLAPAIARAGVGRSYWRVATGLVHKGWVWLSQPSVKVATNAPSPTRWATSGAERYRVTAPGVRLWRQAATDLLRLILATLSLCWLLVMVCLLITGLFSLLFGTELPWIFVAVPLCFLAFSGLYVSVRCLASSLDHSGLMIVVSGRGRARPAQEGSLVHQEVVELRWPESLMPRTARRGAKVRAEMTANNSLVALYCSLFAVLPLLVPAPHPQLVMVQLCVVMGIVIVNFRFAHSQFLQPRRTMIQLNILRCLAQPPAQGLSLGYQDPLGLHRYLLADIARQIRIEARAQERRWPGPAGHPVPVVFRGTARRLDEFVVSEQGLHSPLPTDLEDFLYHLVAVLARQDQPEIFRHLADQVGAFGENGAPDAALVVAPILRRARVFGPIRSGVEHSNLTLRLLYPLATVATLAWLLWRHEVSVGSLYNWKF
jgi:hypothetical protein